MHRAAAATGRQAPARTGPDARSEVVTPAAETSTTPRLPSREINRPAIGIVVLLVGVIAGTYSSVYIASPVEHPCQTKKHRWRIGVGVSPDLFEDVVVLVARRLLQRAHDINGLHPDRGCVFTRLRNPGIRRRGRGLTGI